MTVRALATIDAAEWDLVARMAAASTPSEIESGGVVLARAADGTRRWRIADDGVEAEVVGGVGAPSAAFRIPCRVLWFAAELAQMDGHCELLRDDDGTVIFSAASGQAAVDGRAVHPATEGSRPHGPSARLSAGRLAHLLHAARRVPDGLDLDGNGSALTLRIEDGTVSALVDWRRFGGCRSSFGVPAITSGVAQTTPAHGQLEAVLAHLPPSEDITLVLPPDPDDPVVLLGDNWRASVRQFDLTGGRWSPLLEQVLDAEGLPVDVGDDGSYTVLVGGAEVLITLVDHEGGTLRCSTVLAEGVSGTRDVLHEINALTGGLVGVRVWWTNKQVVAGIDLGCDHMPELGDVLTALVQQTEHLGPIVASLAKTHNRQSRKDAA